MIIVIRTSTHSNVITFTRMGFLGWLIVGVVTTHTYGFCIPLDLLGIKDLRKNKKGQENFQRP